MKTAQPLDTIQATCPRCRGKIILAAGAVDDEGNYSILCPRCHVPVSGKIDRAGNR